MLEALSISEARVTAGLRAWGALMIAFPLVFGPLLGMYVVIVPVMIAGYKAPRWILTWVIATRKRLIRDQMVPFCFALARPGGGGPREPLAGP